MDMKVFAKRLKYIRLQRNISVDELAEAVKVNRTTINRYEKGIIKSIKESKLEDIANYLSVNKDYLCGKTDDKYTTETLEKLSQKQNIEISNVIYFTKDLVKQKNVTLDGKPITETNVDYLIDTIELALEMLKKKNQK